MSHYNTLLSSLSYSLFCSLATASNQRYQIFATFINEKLWFSPVLENFKVGGILKKASPWIEPPWLLTKKKKNWKLFVLMHPYNTQITNWHQWKVCNFTCGCVCSLTQLKILVSDLWVILVKTAQLSHMKYFLEMTITSSQSGVMNRHLS